MNKKIVFGLLIVVLIIGLVSGIAFYMLSLTTPSAGPIQELDFTVSGTSDCLRFLNTSVPTVYVSFTVAANENWQLIINCTKIPGGINGYTDVYIYEGNWDEGVNHLCKSGDL